MIDTFQPNLKSSIHNIFLIPICCLVVSIVCVFQTFKQSTRVHYCICYLALNWCIIFMSVVVALIAREHFIYVEVINNMYLTFIA